MWGSGDRRDWRDLEHRGESWSTQEEGDRVREEQYMSIGWTWAQEEEQPAD